MKASPFASNETGWLPLLLHVPGAGPMSALLQLVTWLQGPSPAPEVLPLFPVKQTDIYLTCLSEACQQLRL